MSLPRLAFGESSALRLKGEKQILEHMSALQRPARDFSYRSKAEDAETVMRCIEADDLAIMAKASVAYVVKTEGDPTCSLRISLSGEGEVRQGNRTLSWHGGGVALVSSYHEPQQLSSGTNSIYILQYRPSALQHVGRVMYGLEQLEERYFSPETPRLMSTWNGEVDYARLLVSAGAMAESCSADPAHLKKIGISDVISRLIVAQLMEGTPYAENAAQPPGRPRKQAALDLVCDHIISRVGRPMTATEMEELSGVSGRSLRYAFQSRFGCSPQEWQRNVHLDHARNRLRHDAGPIIIKALAHELGFSSAQSFAAFYKKRFGELPNETLASPKRNT